MSASSYIVRTWLFPFNVILWSLSWKLSAVIHCFVLLFFLKTEAVMLAIKLGCDDFQASNGWLEAWRRRHDVKFAVLSGKLLFFPIGINSSDKLFDFTDTPTVLELVFISLLFLLQGSQPGFQRMCVRIGESV